MRRPALPTCLLALFGLVAAGDFTGCRKSAPNKSAPAADVGAVKQSLDTLKARFADQKKRFQALRAQVDAIPADFEPFGEVRSRFYAAEEARGTTDAKAAWLASRLDAAAAAGNRAELDQISKDIAATYDDIRRIDEMHVKLLHQVMAFERKMPPPEAAEQKPPAPPSKSKSAKPKSKP